MTWKVWVSLVLVALLGGFFTGVFTKGRHETAKAVAAQQQIQVLGEQVKQEQQAKNAQAQAVVVAKQQAADADAKAQNLLARWNHRPKPLPPIPALPDTPALPSEPIVSNDDLANQTIQALAQDVADQKATVLKLTLEVATDNAIIENQAKEINLGKIAVAAQVAANDAARWSGRFQGAGVTIGITGVVAIGHHLKLF